MDITLFLMDHRPKEIGESSDLVSRILADMAKPYVVDEQRSTVPEDWIEWDMTVRRYPYMRNVITNEPGHIVFDGYFYIEDDTVPVERILRTKEANYHVEIYEKKTLEDTTTGSYDEELGGYISFFSTAIIDLRYRIICIIQSSKQYADILDRIVALEDDRDKVHRRTREECELANIVNNHSHNQTDEYAVHEAAKK